MEPLIIYETSPDWVPSSTYFNAWQGLHYIAWRIGVDVKRTKVLWLIAPVVDYPEPLINLLPVEYTEIILNDDIIRYGHIRSALAKESIQTLETRFREELALTIAAVDLGVR